MITIYVRHWSFDENDKRLIQLILWTYAQEDPTRNLNEFVEILCQHNFHCSKYIVRMIFKQWWWSWRKPSFKQTNKYTAENIQYYGDYMDWARRQDRRRLKFMDEVHFVTNGKLSLVWSLIIFVDFLRRRAIGPIGSDHIILHRPSHQASFSVSCLVQLNQNSPVFIVGKKETNNQLDFVRFIIQCIEGQYLVPGDFLICNNATIHKAEDTLLMIQDILHANRVNLIFLPKYTLELNSCELVFAAVKRHLREYNSQNLPLELEIAIAFHCITFESMQRYYNKCLSHIRLFIIL